MRSHILRSLAILRDDVDELLMAQAQSEYEDEGEGDVNDDVQQVPQ